MYVVVGLGNPGLKYENTRHNVGFKVIDELSKRYSIKINKIKYKSLWNEVKISGERVILLKPQTYMNNSGESVLEIKQFLKIPIENIIVVQDDIDLDLGVVRTRKKGSSGSHNGMKSIIRILGSQDFPRIKIGIGSQDEHMDLSSFVLGKFKKEETDTINEMISKSSDIVESFIKEGIDSTMNKHNIRSPKAQN